MKKALLIAFLVSLVSAQCLQAYDIRMLVDTSIPGIGLFASGQNGSVYLRTSSTAYNALGTDTIDGTNSVFLGTYNFTSSLILAPSSFSLGLIGTAITNGIDEHLQLIIIAGAAKVSIDKLESVWFSSSSDLIGDTITGSSFRIDEIRTGNYPPSNPSVYHIDATVAIQAVPEPATIALWSAGTILVYAVIQRKRRLGGRSNIHQA